MKLPLKAVLKECKRRGISFAEEFDDRGMFITYSGEGYARNAIDKFDELFKYTFFDRGRSKDYSFIINEGIKSTNPHIRESCKKIKSDIDTCINIAEQLKRYIDVKYQKAISDWGKKWNKKFSTTPKRNYSFSLDESEYKRKASQYINGIHKTFWRNQPSNALSWGYIVVDGRKCQDSRIREMAEKIFKIYGHAEMVWENRLKGLLEAK